MPDSDDTPYVITHVWSVIGKGRKWIDYQKDVHVKDIELAARENFRSV